MEKFFLLIGFILGFLIPIKWLTSSGEGYAIYLLPAMALGFFLSGSLILKNCDAMKLIKGTGSELNKLVAYALNGSLKKRSRVIVLIGVAALSVALIVFGAVLSIVVKRSLMEI